MWFLVQGVNWCVWIPSIPGREASKHSRNGWIQWVAHRPPPPNALRSHQKHHASTRHAQYTEALILVLWCHCMEFIFAYCQGVFRDLPLGGCVTVLGRVLIFYLKKCSSKLPTLESQDKEVFFQIIIKSIITCCHQVPLISISLSFLSTAYHRVNYQTPAARNVRSLFFSDHGRYSFCLYISW